MKVFSSALVVGLAAVMAVAAPSISERQNDIKKCKDGIQGPDGGYDKQADCKKDCYLKENADGDEKGNACLGICINVGHPAPIFTCRATVSLSTAGTTPEAGHGNLTIALFPDQLGDSCNANDISGTVSLTTSSVPVVYTCFNVSDIFSQGNSTGFQNSTSNVYDSHGEIEQPNGVAWSLQNQNLYDAKANYSRVWYSQANVSEIKEGKDAPWVFYTYAFPDCRQLGEGHPEKGADPWFETSCQTSKDGQCRSTPGPIVSFAINRADSYNKGHGGCETWARLGAAARPGQGVGSTVVVVASLVAIMLSV
ncbi:hypothetical protein V2A60_010443 [Cordyceps javanica]